jgi:hypothetical protein
MPSLLRFVGSSGQLSGQRVIVLSVAFVSACIFLYSTSNFYTPTNAIEGTHHPAAVSRPTIRDAFQTLYDAIRHPVAADSYTDAYGNVFEIKPDGPYWTEPLKEKILIVDIDTRVPQGENELWSKGRMNWETLKEEGDGGMISASQMNHFLYGK